MNCNLQLTGIAVLQQKGIIDEDYVLPVTNVPEFETENLRQQQATKKETGYTGNLLPFKYFPTSINGEPVFMVTPNEKFFDAIDKLPGVETTPLYDTEQITESPAVYQSTASAEAMAKVKQLLEKLGVQVIPDFTLEGSSIAGLARTLLDIRDMVYGEVRYAPSKENRVLVEEAFHIIEAMLPSDVRLQLMEQVTNYKIYDETLEAYSPLPQYQLEDGSPNIVKIKREAVGKLLAEYYIGLHDKKNVNNERLGNIFERIWAWIKSIVSKDIFKQTVNDIFNEQYNFNALFLQDDMFQVDPQYVSNFEKSYTKEMDQKLRDITLKIQPLLRGMEISLKKTGVAEDYIRAINETIKDGQLQGVTDLLSSVLNYLDDVERFSKDMVVYSKKVLDPIALVIRENAQKGKKGSGLSNISQEKKIQLIKDLHFLNNVVNNLKSITNEYKTALNANRLASNDWLVVTIDNIKENMSAIELKLKEEGVLSLVASSLFDVVSDSLEPLEKEYAEQLKWVNNELDGLALIETRRTLTKQEKNKVKTLKALSQKIIAKRDATLPTEENILKALTDGSDPRNPIYAMFQFWMRTDELHSAQLTAAYATFVKDGLKAVNAEKDNIASEMAAILDELEAERGNTEDADKLYKGFYREVTVKKFIERTVTDAYGRTEVQGELKEYPAKVLNGDFDNIRFSNDIETLKYQIFQEETKDIQNFETIDKLKKQLEDLLSLSERPYVQSYYDIMNILTDEDRSEIEALYRRRNLLEKFGNYEDLDDGSLDEIEEIDKEIARLSSLTDIYGKPLPPGDALDKALRFKAYREAVLENELYIYEVTEESKERFESKKKVIDAQYKEVSDRFSVGKATEEEFDAALAARNNWYYFNSREVIDDEFYVIRQEILDDIDALLSPYLGANKEAVGDLYNQIFNMLRGFKDAFGAYRASDMPAELRAKVKELQIQIQELREIPDLPEDVEEEKEELFKELAQLQSTRNTFYWTEARREFIDESIARRESEFIATFRGTQDEINKEVGRRRIAFKKLAEKEFESSTWYAENTIEHTYINKKGEEITKRIPIMVWRQTSPKNESLIRVEPGKMYSTRKVNPEYFNPNYNESIPYKTTTSPLYANTNTDYVGLTAKEKEILKKYRNIYFEYQKNNPYNGRLGEILPFVHKSGMDLTVEWTKALGDLLTLKPGRINQKLSKLFNWARVFWRRNVSMRDDDEEIQGSVKERDYLDKEQPYYKKSIYIPYVRPFDNVNEISSDITESIAAYGMEAAKTQLLIQMNPLVATIGEQVSGNVRINKGVRKTIEHTYRKEFLSEKSVIRTPNFGKTRFGRFFSKLIESTQKVMITRMGSVRKNAMALNGSSEIANAVNNIYQIFIMNGIYNVTPKDIKKSAFKVGRKMITDKGDILSTGRSKEFLRMVRFFGSAGQEESTEKLAGTIRTSVWRKWFNTDTIYRSRELAELYFTAVMVDVIGSKTMVKLNGTYVPITQAFEVRDNKYLPKPGAEIPNKVLNHLRRNVNKMSVDLRGAYGNNAPHASKFLFGKMVLFLNGYYIPQLVRRWSTDITYGTGTINYGTSVQFYKGLLDMWRYRKFFEYKMTDNQRKAFRAGMKEQIWYLAHYILLATLYATRGSDDDDPDGWLAYILYMWKRIFGETDTFAPTFPINYTLARIHEPQRSGASTTGSSASDAAYNFITKMFEDKVYYPVVGRGTFDGLGLLADVPNWGDPYYGEYYLRGHGKNSDVPIKDIERARVMNPQFSGLPNFVIGTLKLFNQSESAILNPERANQFYELYNYNLYMTPTEPLFIRKKKKEN
jgi:hypothetical protein